MPCQAIHYKTIKKKTEKKRMKKKGKENTEPSFYF